MSKLFAPAAGGRIAWNAAAGAFEIAAGFEDHPVVEASWYGTQRVSLPLGEGFHALRLTLKSSQVGAVAASARPRWDARRRMELAVSLLVEPALDALITSESSFDALPETLTTLTDTPGDTLCHVIRY